MKEKIDIIKKQSPDDWVWAGTTIISLICGSKEIEKNIKIQKEKIENSEMDLLDIHVFTWGAEGGYDMVNIQFLIRPILKYPPGESPGYVI